MDLLFSHSKTWVKIWPDYDYFLTVICLLLTFIDFSIDRLG